MPSVTILPLTPDPVGTAAAAGTEPDLKVMVLPLTVKTSPSEGAPFAAMVETLAAPARVRPRARLAAVPAPSAAATPTSEADVPPSVIALVIAVVPPAVPLVTTLLTAVALVKEVVPRRSVAVAPEIVAETLDLVE